MSFGKCGFGDCRACKCSLNYQLNKDINFDSKILRQIFEFWLENADEIEGLNIGSLYICLVNNLSFAGLNVGAKKKRILYVCSIENYV
jgi:hypothetical protein